MGVAGGGHQLRTARLRGDLPNTSIFPLFKIAPIFYAPALSFVDVCMMLPDVPANINPQKY